MNWLFKLYNEQGELLYKVRYLGYGRRAALRAFREEYGLVGKRLGDRLWVEQLGVVV